MLQQVQPIPFFQLRKNPLLWARHPMLMTGFGQGYSTGALFSEFYCDPVNGSNLNSGTDQNASPLYLSTNGNWDGANTFIPTDGSNPAALGVTADMVASVYVDGATTGVFLGKISVVTPAGIVIAFGTGNTNKWIGAKPTSSATGRSIRVGGAWKGPNGSDLFPFNFTTGNGWENLMNLHGDAIRINFKNNGTYTFTGISLGDSLYRGNTYQGFASSPGDGGKAIFANTFATSVVADGNRWVTWIDFIFDNAANISGVTPTFSAAQETRIIRCVARNGWGHGFQQNAQASGQAAIFIECEAYNCNRSNTVSIGGFNQGVGNVNAFYLRCISHDHTTANGHGFAVSSQGAFHINCIAFNCNGHGFYHVGGSNIPSTQIYSGCDSYNNARDGLNAGVTDNQFDNVFWIENCNFFKNQGFGISATVAVSQRQKGFILNCGFGAGTYANRSGRLSANCNLLEQGTVVFPVDISPWRSPDTGDFSIVAPYGKSAGRGVFTEVDGTHLGTTGYPDIGAAPHLDTGLRDTETTFPAGYIAHAYSIVETFSGNITVSLLSGTLPLGLFLSQGAGNNWTVSGTPTTLGTYDFVVRVTSGSTVLDYTCHITILDDPDQGIGGVGGG